MAVTITSRTARSSSSLTTMALRWDAPTTDEDVDDGPAFLGSRREALLRAGTAAASVTIVPYFVLARPRPALAETARADNGNASAYGDNSDGSLTTRLFNPDGSLRDPSAAGDNEAKSRAVTISFPPGDGTAISVDGSSPQDGGGGEGGARVSYVLPAKWGSTPGTDLYVDPSEGINARAVRRIAVYRVSGIADPKTLQRATTAGVARALGAEAVSDAIGYDLKSLMGADLVSGKKSTRGGDGGVDYYEFDLAAAPETCAGAMAKENLGLGFCPYDTIVLMGACVASDGRMYVISVESDRDMWKRANADLKRVRTSFAVEVL